MNFYTFTRDFSSTDGKFSVRDYLAEQKSFRIDEIVHLFVP